jgi:MoaA/NifB/PqqE/SkfB family radical SAM enzyme
MSNFYCAAPWRGLHINPQGEVKTCCAGDAGARLNTGNLNTNSITEILNGDFMQEVRESLSKGVPHSYCSGCVQSEQLGSDSERKWHNDKSPDIDYTTAGLQYHYPVIVDARWNNTCNLSCNYCDPAVSSKWASLVGIPFKSGSRPYYNDVCDFINANYENIRDVALVGGEPLLLPENERLLDVIPDDCNVTIITNMTADLEKNKIFKKLIQRKNVGWSMSFDNIGARFDYVRYGSNWETLNRNLSIVKELFKQGHWGGIHAVYNIYNATRITEFREWSAEQGVSVLWNNLFYPDCLNPLSHGPEVANLAIEEIEKFYDTGLATEHELQQFNNVLHAYKQVTQDRPNITRLFKDHTNRIETKFHPDQAGQFQKLWPEFNNILT